MHTDIIDSLIDKDLFLIASAFRRGDEKDLELLEGKLRRELGIDITDINSIQSISDDLLNALKQFEVDKKDFLITTIRKGESEPGHYPIPHTTAADDVHLINFRYRLATILVIMALLYIFAVTFYEVPKENQSVVYMATGIMISVVIGGIMTYFFNAPPVDKKKFGIPDTEDLSKN